MNQAETWICCNDKKWQSVEPWGHVEQTKSIWGKVPGMKNRHFVIKWEESVIKYLLPFTDSQLVLELIFTFYCYRIKPMALTWNILLIPIYHLSQHPLTIRQSRLKTKEDWLFLVVALTLWNTVLEELSSIKSLLKTYFYKYNFTGLQVEILTQFYWLFYVQYFLLLLLLVISFFFFFSFFFNCSVFVLLPCCKVHCNTVLKRAIQIKFSRLSYSWNVRQQVTVSKSVFQETKNIHRCRSDTRRQVTSGVSRHHWFCLKLI